MTFKIKLAGVTVAIQSLYDEVYTMCRDYLTDGDEAFTVTVRPEDIAFEREQSAQLAQTEHRPVGRYPEPYLETLAVYRQIAEGMLKFNTCLMHGSAVAVGDEAFLFTAPSGTGKTTHTGLWLSHIPGAYIVNGDKPLIRADETGSVVCGTPWSGKECLHTNAAVPLSAICVLQRGEQNRIEPIDFGEAYPTLFCQIYRPADREDVARTMSIINNLSKTVRFFRLTCNREPEAAFVAFEGMRQKTE